MKNAIRTLLAMAVLLAFGAQAAVSVDSINYPAWVQRGNVLEPLAPNVTLEAGDEVRTGSSGRAWLALDDGSVIKLGNNAKFVIQRARFEDAADGSLLDAAFDVIVGAFRFTSRFFTPQRNATHRVDFTVGAVTAGIRGTDIWGRSADDEDFVALLEGRIEVSAGDATPEILDQPLSLYLKKAGEPATSTTVDSATVQQLAPETELDIEAGIANTTGSHALVVMSLRSDALVEANLQRFRQAGYPVNAQAVEIEGGSTTRLLLAGLADRQAADNLRPRLEREFGISGIWVTTAP